MNPEADPRSHVLILLCGISPAIVTETVFALAQSGDPPEQIVVITTVAGEERLRRELWDSGIWAELKENLKCDISFSFNQKHLRLLPNGDGNASDVADTFSAEQAGSFILEVLRQYTENPDTRITFSIAGGRKSMSALGALCMSLLGRKDDRLCHILVNPPFDDPVLRPRFYFPVPGRSHVDREGTLHDSESARLSLSILPFVHCRYLIAKELRRLPGNYSRMVALASHSAEQLNSPIELELIPECLTVRIGEEKFSLQFLPFLLYWMLAERRRNGQEPLYHRRDLGEEFAAFAELVPKRLPSHWKYWYHCMDLNEKLVRDENLTRRISELAAELKKRGIPELFFPTRERGVYGLGIAPSQILVREFRTSAGSPET